MRRPGTRKVPGEPPVGLYVLGVCLLVVAMYLLTAGCAGPDPEQAEADARERAACRALRVPGRATFDGQPGWLTFRYGDGRIVAFVPDGAPAGKYRLTLTLWCSEVVQQSRGPE